MKNKFIPPSLNIMGKKATALLMATAMVMTTGMWVSAQESDTEENQTEADTAAFSDTEEEVVVVTGRFDMPEGLLGDNYSPMSEDDLFELDDYIMDLEDANKAEVLTADGSGFYMQNTQYSSDGTGASASAYLSQEYSYYMEDWFSICFHGDKTYGTTVDDADQILPQAVIAIGEGAQDVLKESYLPTTIFPVNEGEELCAFIEGEEYNNLVYSIPIDNIVAMSFTENSGYDPEAGTGFYHIVGIDPATKLVKWNEYYYELDGEDIFMGGYDVLTDQKITPDEETEAAIYEAEDNHTVTFIADPATDQEETYSITVGKGVLVGMYCVDESKMIYDDEACTIEHQSRLDTENDFTLYLK